MRIRLIPLLLVSVLVTPEVSCKRTGDGDTAGPRTGRTRTARPPSMPRPLRLPDQPGAAFHIDALTLLDAAAAWHPQATDGRTLVGRALGTGPLELERAVLPHVAPGSPIDLAVVEGQTIVQIPIDAAGLPQVEQLLAGKPAAGKFGAVDLGRPGGPGGAKLAYLDKGARTLTLADDLPGIATGRELAKAYGKQPLFVALDRDHAGKWGIDLPVDRIELRGKGTHDFSLTATGLPEDRPELDLLTDGALTGLLQFPELAVGASSKYADHKKVVGEFLGQAKREVDKQNFLVRGVLEDLLNRTRAVMTSWDGRVMVGVGPQGHVLLGLGASDPGKAENATLHLIAGVLGNLKTAQSIGLGGLPKIRFARSWGKAADVTIHAIALERATSSVPPQYRALLNEQGELKISMAFSPRAGGALVVVGAESPRVLTRWLEATAKARTGRETLSDTLAARIAVSPTTLASVLTDETGAKALGLAANGSALQVVAARTGNAVEVKVTGSPSPSTAKTARRVPPSGKRTPPPRAAGRRPGDRQIIE
jgi:hypothetical protein